MRSDGSKPATSAALAVRGGRVVTESAIFDASILVDGTGRITALLDPEMPISARETVDASGLLVFPGGVDTHSHLNDPGLTESEDFETGTSGAAAGGYTTVLEMPQTLPLVDSVETFRHKLATVGPKAIVDFGLYGALVPANHDDLQALGSISEVGAIALKGFVCDTPEMPTLGDDELGIGMKNARAVGLPVAIHCESQPVIDRETDRLRREGVHTADRIAEAHPLESEENSVRAVLEVAKTSGGMLHLVHMSHPSTVRMAAEARFAGADVSIETCPHYLTFTKEKLKEAEGWGLCFPPFRLADAVEGLWQAVRLGLIDAIGSDHCAYTLDQKVTADPWDVLPGINGMQLSLPVMVDGALRRDVPLTHVAKAFSSNPARRFSLHPRKGSIVPGADADLVLIDLNSSVTARARDLFTRCPGTVYEGMTFEGRVRRTMVRGVTVYLDQDEPTITVAPGSGTFLHGGVARASRGTEISPPSLALPD